MSQVSDYNIANASGASVRSDLNSVFDAIKTLNSGGSDPSNPAAFMPYVDTGDNNNLKIRNSANNGFTTIGPVNSANLGLLPRSGGTMTGQLLLDNSAGASAPAISFNNDTNTGIYRTGANKIGFATAGTERVEISNSGLDVSNGLPIRFQDSSGAPFIALKAPSSVFANRTFTLPRTTGSVGQFLAVSSSNHSSTNAELEFSSVQGVPSGSVFCMAVATVPSGYLECNGAAVSRTTYSALFAIIGTQYGTGNGSSTFNLPDLRGEFVRGFDNGRGVDSGRSIASGQGAQNSSHHHTATSSVTDPGHRHLPENYSANSTQSNGHTIAVNDRVIGNYGGGSGNGLGPLGNRHFMETETTGISVTTTVALDGGNDGQGSRPRNVAMMYVIKT